jgi:hypothetical protein
MNARREDRARFTGALGFHHLSNDIEKRFAGRRTIAADTANSGTRLSQIAESGDGA